MLCIGVQELMKREWVYESVNENECESERERKCF